MNDAGREKLVAAAMSGVKQIRGSFQTADGLCALGVLGMRKEKENTEETVKAFCNQWGIGLGWAARRCCPICFADSDTYLKSVQWDELGLIAHYNDVHDMDFLTIARKI